MIIEFRAEGEFAAMYEAQDWCRARGISVGSAERGSPRGLLVGDYLIAKWRNLNAAERTALHGTMEGDMRVGPVRVHIKGAYEHLLFAPSAGAKA